MTTATASIEPQGVAEWTEVISGLQTKREETESAITKAQTAARGLALPAAQGDKKSADELAKVEGQSASALRSLATLDEAMEQARAGLAAVQAADARKARDAREEKAAEAAARVVARAARIDELRGLLKAEESAVTAEIRTFQSLAENPHPRLSMIAYKPGNVFGLAASLQALLRSYLRVESERRAA